MTRKPMSRKTRTTAKTRIPAYHLLSYAAQFAFFLWLYQQEMQAFARRPPRPNPMPEWDSFEREYRPSPDNRRSPVSPYVNTKEKARANFAAATGTNASTVRAMSQEEGKAAYRKAVLRLHPNKTGGTTAKEFISLQASYDLLFK